MPADIIQMPGITKCEIPPDTILSAALGKLDSCLLIGYDHDGNLWLASSDSHGPDILWKIEAARLNLFAQFDEGEDEL